MAESQPLVEVEVEIKDDKKWVSGDVSLISADNVRFRVSSSTLVWSSAVFADLFSVPNPTENKDIHLTDHSLESSEIVRLFLDVVTASAGFKFFKAIPKLYGTGCRHLVKLVEFLDKYNSEVGVRLLRLFGAEAALHKNINAEELFVFASQINDLALCYRILVAYPDWRWLETDDSGLFTAHTKGRSLFDVSRAPLKFCCALPFPYMWALSRATLFFNPMNNMDKFAHKFVEIVTATLKEAKTNDSPHQHAYCASFPPIIAKPRLDGYRKPSDSTTAK